MSTKSIPPCLDLLLDGNIARITFNNPAARNAMTWPMYEELKSICDDLAKNPDIRVVIVGKLEALARLDRYRLALNATNVLLLPFQPSKVSFYFSVTKHEKCIFQICIEQNACST